MAIVDKTRVANAMERACPSGLVSAYLFGSHAEERAHRESDLDVAVLLEHTVFPSPSARFDERVRVTSELAAELGIEAIDVVVLNDVPPLLGRRIVTHGIRLVCRDREADHAFVRNVQLRAADLLPFLERTRKTKLRAIAR